MDLAARTLALVDVASESRDEAELHGRLLAELAQAGARDAGDLCLLAGTTSRGDRPLVLLCGHLDTVPAQGNRPGRIEDGVVHGLGAADMKGGVAVAIDALLTPSAGRTCDVGLVLFPREELPFGDTALTPLLEREPALRHADLAIVLEPTANELHLGCLGNLNARWTFHGTAGHSARPWLADNAIHRAALAIAEVATVPPHPVAFGELTFTEVVSVTQLEGGVAKNVVPDTCVAQVNARYAPGRGATEAEAWLRGLCEAERSELEITGNAPSGAVASGPLVDRLVAAGDLAVAPKQAWTPVAELANAGVSAVNLGPGDPAYAHRRDEQVAVAALERCRSVLERFLCG